MAERERGVVPRGSSRTLGDPPLGLSLCQESPPRTSRRSRESGKEKVPEVPRIWEGEGSRRSEIMNASNNDYWVGKQQGKSSENLEEVPRIWEGEGPGGSENLGRRRVPEVRDNERK